MLIEEQTWNRVATEEQRWLKAKLRVEEIIRELGLKTTVRVTGSRHTCYRPQRVDGSGDLIQFGYLHGTAGKIYCEYQGKLVVFRWPLPSTMTYGFINACIIIEEVAHAWNYAEGGKDHHQGGFFRHFIRLWNKVNANNELVRFCEEIWR